MTKPQTNKRGRPPIPESERRIGRNVTIRAADMAFAKVRRLKPSQVIDLGFEHARQHHAPGCLTHAEDCVLHFAFRYALGRTLAAEFVAVQLKRNWPRLRESTRQAIHHEIREAMEGGDLGHNCDLETWRAVLSLPQNAKGGDHE